MDASRYYLYDELVQSMYSVAQSHPQLVKVYPIGRSPQGRELLVAEITQTDTGPAHEKPACWVDGNTHASELAGSTAALFLIHYLATHYGQDPEVTHLLDTRAFYVLPRLSPDGAEYCLTRGEFIRSTPKPYPFEERWEGVRPQDLNGDNMVLQMRVESPHGEWKISKNDPRILVRRLPDDRHGPFYHVYREGLLEEWDGHRIEVKDTPYGMDFNRNYPFQWEPEHVQTGAGRFPLSEPETRAVVEFLSTHRNVGAVHTLHTYSAVILRPSSVRSDDEMPAMDLAIYKMLGERGTELTGYPCLSCYHDFRYTPKEVMHGSFDDWCYEHYGVHAFTTELWHIGKAAGLPINDHIKFLNARTEEETLAILRWCDNEGIEGFVPWTPFHHPQLGRVEIGGWKILTVWSNPPERFLPGICNKVAHFIMAHAAATPRLGIEHFSAEALAPGLRKVTLDVVNEGWLPTHISQRAIDARIVRPIEVEITLGTDCERLIGKRRTELGHLTGTANVVADGCDDPVYFKGMSQSHRARLEWLVRGSGPISIEVRSEKAGILRAHLP